MWFSFLLLINGNSVAELIDWFFSPSFLLSSGQFTMLKEAKDGTNWACNIQRSANYSITLMHLLYISLRTLCWFAASLGFCCIEAREMGYESVAHLLMDELKRRNKLKSLQGWSSSSSRIKIKISRRWELFWWRCMN